MQIFAMTLLALRSAVDRKTVLGRVSVLMWVDMFYLVQFIMCLLAAIETAVVHKLARSKMQSFALYVPVAGLSRRLRRLCRPA